MGTEAEVTGDERALRAAERLVLPGVGAFGACMRELKARGFDELVHERVAAGVPLLGVCVGMQMLFDESEEFGHTAGLGLLRGRVRRFSHDLHVPQVGWNMVKQNGFHHPLLSGVEDNAFFYFVHSFYCETATRDVIVGQTEYGISYPSVVAQKNISGVQFHPEKSQSAGLRLLKNFAEQTIWNGQD